MSQAGQFFSKNFLKSVIDTFQRKDCKGNPKGNLQTALKVITINKQIVSVCNAKEISNPVVLAVTETNNFFRQQKILSKVFKTVTNNLIGVDPAETASPFYLSTFTGQPVRSVTFTLWGIDKNNTAFIDFGGNAKLYNNERYNGYTFSFGIDKLIDLTLALGKLVEVIGNAEVDVIFTYEN